MQLGIKIYVWQFPNKITEGRLFAWGTKFFDVQMPNGDILSAQKWMLDATPERVNQCKNPPRELYFSMPIVASDLQIKNLTASVQFTHGES
jgi:hypothetical protein